MQLPIIYIFRILARYIRVIATFGFHPPAVRLTGGFVPRIQFHRHLNFLERRNIREEGIRIGVHIHISKVGLEWHDG